MSGLGWSNPLPLSIGGGTSKTEDVYSALRSAIGVGGAGPVDSLEDLWRQCKAQTIASVVVDSERAVLQAFPHVATDAIPSYERILGLDSADEDSDEVRRRAIVAAWTLELMVIASGIQDSLQAIDPRFSVTEVPYAATLVTHLGRMFFSADEPGNAIGYPNYSDDFVLHVVWDPSVDAAPSVDVMDAAEHLLNTVLPAWVDFSIVSESSGGFCCDGGPDGTSLLDLKALGH